MQARYALSEFQPLIPNSAKQNPAPKENPFASGCCSLVATLHSCSVEMPEMDFSPSVTIPPLS